jgi:RNA polymerase sigma factor (sigma-70 family)
MRLPSSEPALVKLAGSCNAQAFTALVDSHRRRLQLIAKRFLESLEEREDMVQDVIARLLHDRKRALREWQPFAPFAAYLSTIAYRRGLNVANAQARLNAGRVPALPDADPLDERWLPLTPTDAPDPHAEVVSSDRDRVLREALSALPPRDQVILQLRFYEDLRPAEIARIMGLSPGAARKAVFDSVRRLRKHLAPHTDLIGDQGQAPIPE